MDKKKEDDPKSETTDIEQSEERFKLLVSSIKDYAIFILGPKGHIRSWNAGAQRFKGYKASEIIGKHFSVFYTQYDIERNHPQKELEIATKEGMFEEEGWRVRKDGSVFWASVVITKLVDTEGNHIGFAKVTRDLTERKKNEERLLESEEKYRLLISSVKDYAIFMLTPAGKVSTWNEGAEGLQGYTSERILGKHFSTFYTPEDLKKSDQELVECEISGRIDKDCWLVKEDGTKFWANMVISAVRKETGKLLGFTMVIRDMTARRQLEEELRATNEMLDNKVKERTLQLEKAIQFRDDFISIVSHELRTPVTALKLQAQTALRQLKKDSPLDFHKKSETIFKKIDQQLAKMNVLLNDILDISKISMDRFQVSKERIEINGIIQEVVERFEEQARSVGTTIEFIDGPMLFTLGDRVRLEQVFSNLITNALKYGNSKPVRVSLELIDKEIAISFTDQGIGIAPEDQERIFERFQRATNQNHISGVGVGLFISKKIIDSHEGKILLKSELGKGSTFTVLLHESH